MKPAKFTPVVVSPVTFETVRERLSYLEGLNAKGAGTAVKSQQFEIACLRELLVRLESRTVTVKLPEPPGPMSIGARTVYFGIVADVVRSFQDGLTAAGIKVETE
ncbi:hypothetical protein [Klebsiella pneumoniae]|uniref:hypothetical protein n=1 Tax=Klebsiella pneumoniae TaxID=573 RepID=UPI000C18AB2E|nr:hypothetical protein [Klebsiella pneumoniae]ATR41636.1 hypothetical protein CTI63_09265 [Klebsiella pneumoniae]ATR46953.1 hypothetical protein CTI65_09260 [Klebsiella pneumoniae]